MIIKRLVAVILKEFIQMKRDKATFAMIIVIPLMQLLLFGFAINNNPRDLPTAVVNPENTPFSREILIKMQNSTYFKFLSPFVSEEEASLMLKQGKAQFVLNFPANFSRDLVRGLHPNLLLEVDASDPVAASFALSVFSDLGRIALKDLLIGPLTGLNPSLLPYQPLIQTLYNPLQISAYNIVPGLLGVVLTMTMVIITALVITREYEMGTMENLLATPLTRMEIMGGKILPYIMVGYAQIVIMLILAKLIFSIPMQGSILLLLVLCLPFIGANLAMGLTFSSIAKNQLQAIQAANFFFLPSILLSGFMFPFQGMPAWAQWIGSIFPLTHFLRIVRGILLKGNGFAEVWQELVPILLFAIIVLVIGFKRLKKTLD